jgi:hypothetical protein
MLVRFLLLTYWTLFVWVLAETTWINAEGVGFYIQDLGGFFYSFDNTESPL